MYRKFGKRIFDVSFAAMGLLLLLPVLCIISISLLLSQGAPILFRQQRPGLHHRPFTILKFRTMTSREDSAGNLLPDVARVTWLGRLLRRTSLDEVPELLNVLRGEMSLVGPRPLLMEYLPRYSSAQLRRHDVRPGITGWAQVHGRQRIPFSARLAHDQWYVDNYSCAVDLRVLCLTVYRVFRAEGVIEGQDVNEVDDLGLSGTASPSETKRNREP